tara:strand:+ start:759 stop:1085 length:327 start_codon:yes stop_codon:yes gene_type:complete
MKHTVGNLARNGTARVYYFLIFANADLTNFQRAFANADHQDHTQVITVAARDVLTGKRTTNGERALQMLGTHNQSSTHKAQLAEGWSCGNGDWELVCHPSWTRFALGA